jgi:arylsulfatase A
MDITNHLSFKSPSPQRGEGAALRTSPSLGVVTLLVVLTSASVRYALAADVSQPQHRPNFLVILCDDLGYGDLGCYGHPHIKTPNLDKLASQGIRLTDCYSAAPVCSPSRAGLLTGRIPSRLGVYDWIPVNHEMHLPRNAKTIATVLRDAGYATAQVGKWHCNGKFNSPDQPQPGDHGFEHWMSTQNNAGPSHLNPRNFVRNGKPVGPSEGYSCQIVTDEAIHWLKGVAAGAKPFFLHVCFHETHEPVESPPDLVKSYPQAKNEDQAQYFANATNMDQAVGRLMTTLDEIKFADRTLVVFTSDNGPETLLRYGTGSRRSHGSAGPLRGMKLHLYDGGIRVPGILRWTGRIQPGQVISQPVWSLDLFPTICELAGVRIPDGVRFDGTSVAPLLDGKPIQRSSPMFWHYYRSLSEPKAALRDGDWMVVGQWGGPATPIGNNVNPDSMRAIKSSKLTKFELYNLRDDIAEKSDLTEREPDRLRELAGKLTRMYTEVVAEGTTWDVLPEKK